ncbi:hypothetical protein BCR34DRAFT_665657 [Clohesyomyces aquaticus]|uniref:Uncharacterized protein n=1 Tax=Clohesyomyces aquaticus TaxID=1231657 RepID=A0A1Y1ZG24_9PLEO|nr:hypothetical protein BCR34DRAFT_665657 [Clohesyomyces aquaticus]
MSRYSVYDRATHEGSYAAPAPRVIYRKMPFPGLYFQKIYMRHNFFVDYTASGEPEYRFQCTPTYPPPAVVPPDNRYEYFSIREDMDEICRALIWDTREGLRYEGMFLDPTEIEGGARLEINWETPGGVAMRIAVVGKRTGGEMKTEEREMKREGAAAKREGVVAKREEVVAKREEVVAKREEVVAKREEVVAKREEVVAKREEVVAKREEVQTKREVSVAEL